MVKLKYGTCAVLFLVAVTGAASGDDGVVAPNTAEPAPSESLFQAPDLIKFSGSQRTRYSYLENQFRPLLGSNDQAISLRTLLRADAQISRRLSLTAELQDSRAYLTDENSGASTIVVNTAAILQAHLTLNTTDVFRDGDTLALQAGRFTMDLGGRRLIARNRFRNTIQNYTGFSADWRSGHSTRLFTFYVLPVLVNPFDPESIRENEFERDTQSRNLGFWGAFLDQRIKPLGANLEMYFFGLDEKDGANRRTTRNRNLFTPGLRLVRLPKEGTWDFDLEGVYQFGESRASRAANDTTDLDVSAHFYHATVGYTFKRAWKPRLSAEFDYASGERSRSDDEINRFDSLFGPRRAEFGPTGIYGLLGRENIVSAGIRLGARPSSRWDGYVSWRANWLVEESDFFARSLSIDPAGESGRFAGHQVELRIRYWLIPDFLRYEVGAASFLKGAFLRNAPVGTNFGDPLFVYTDFTFNF